MQTINFDKIRFVPYDPLYLPLISQSDFSCGNKELDDFLKEELEKHRLFMLTQSTLIIYEDKQIIGYFSLQTDAIKLSEEERTPFKAKEVGYRTFPAVKIGRLAIDKRFTRVGIGSIALKVIVGIILSNHEQIATRFITVDAKDTKNALDFYIEKHGFIRNLSASKNSETISLRYDLHNPNKI